MSETATPTATPEAPPAEQQIMSAEALASAMFPGEDFSKVRETLKQTPVATPAVEPAVTAGAQTPNEPEKTTHPATPPAEVVPPVVASDVDLDLPEALRPQKPAEVNSEELLKSIKEEFGIDPGNVTEVATKLKEVAEFKGKYENIVSDIQKLDPVVQAMLQANLDGEDPHQAYEKAIGRRIDFTKSAENQNMETLIATYASDVMSVEEYREAKELDVEDKQIKAAEKLALAKFEADQEKFKGNQSRYEKQKADKLKSFADSVDLSIQTASKQVANPNSKEFTSVVEKVKQQGVVPIFYNQDGTLRSDAVEKVFFAEHGRSFVDQLVKQNQKLIADLKAKSEELAKSTGSLPEKTPEIPGGGEGGAGGEIPAWVKAIVERKA